MDGGRIDEVRAGVALRELGEIRDLQTSASFKPGSFNGFRCTSNVG